MREKLHEHHDHPLVLRAVQAVGNAKPLHDNMALLVSRNRQRGYCELRLVDSFGRWLLHNEKPLMTTKLSGAPCQRLLEDAKRLAKPDDVR